MSPMNRVKEITIEEFTTPSPIFVSPEDNLQMVKDLLKKEGIRHMPVIKENIVVGILSDRDVKLLESCFEDLSSLKVEFVMTPDPYTVALETPLEEVVFNMSKEKIGIAIVQSPGEDFVGIFTSTDALNALLEILRGEI